MPTDWNSPNLETWRAESPRWGLEAFVLVVNGQLALTRPARPSDNTKLREAFNPRLIRHYTTMGLIAAPERAGKEARYTYLHLLQALVIRRSLFEGFTAPALRQILAGKSTADYEALLADGLRFGSSFPPAIGQADANAAIEPAASAPVSLEAVSWRRARLADGIELHLRGDVRPPVSAAERAVFATRVADCLHSLSSVASLE